MTRLGRPWVSRWDWLWLGALVVISGVVIAVCWFYGASSG